MATKTKPLRVILHAIPDVNLSLEANVDDATPKWQHVANEGQYLGYKPPFAFTRGTFAEMVKNFRASPQYKAGDDGVGIADVVAWDFEHASEQYAGDGTIPVSGTPAQGWVRELKVEDGPDGKAQLWALSVFLPTAKEYIKNGQYKWSSVAVIRNAEDPVSGEKVGAVLTSIALTNQPFIQNLTPLAASQNANGFKVERWYSAAGSALEAVGCFKDLLGLGELATIPEVLAQLNKLKQWVESGTTPIGVDVAGLFAAFRQILNLGALTTETEVLDAISKIAQRAIEEQAVSDGAPIAQPGMTMPVNTAATMAGANGGDEMIKTLASKFGVKEVEKEVLEAADDAIELRATVSKTLASSEKTKDIVSGIAALKATSDEHSALLKALGASKADDAISCVADLQKKAKELDELKPKSDALEKRIMEIDLKQAEADVDMVIAANGFNAALKDALMLQRQSDPKAFAEKFPVDPAKMNLTRPVTVQVPGAPVTPAVSAPVDKVDLSGYPGVNMTEKALKYLASKNAGFESMDWDDKCVMAHNLLKNVVK